MEKDEDRLLSYCCSKNSAVIYEKVLDTGDICEFIAQEAMIVFITHGSLLFTMERHIDVKIEAPQMFLIPSGSSYQRTALSKVSLTLMPITSHVELCDCFDAEDIQHKKTSNKMLVEQQGGLYSLTITPLILDYLTLLTKSVRSGLSCTHYLEVKVKELIYIMGVEYTEDERIKFFDSVITNDDIFRDFIYKTYNKVRSIKELAELSYYSLSGFEKRFRRVFGKSASQWINEKKATDIYIEIRKGEKTFKELSTEYDFSSPSHFSYFCKTQLGNTPSKLRIIGIEGELLKIKIK